MSSGWSTRPEVAAEVSRLLAAEVAGRGIRAETQSGVHSDEPRIRLNGTPLAVRDLVEACAAADPDQWALIVHAAVDRIVGRLPQPGDAVGPPASGTAVADEEGETADVPSPAPAGSVPSSHLDGLRTAARARLLGDPPVGSDSWQYAHPVAPGLRLGLELAYGQMHRLLLDAELDQVPIPTEELFSIGWRNAWGERLEESEHAPGILALTGPYAATRVAEFGPIAARLGAAPHGLVLAVPTPHLVLCHLVRRDTVLVVEQLAAEAERLAENGGVTSRLYYWASGRLDRIDLDGSPRGRFADAVATALI